MSNNPHSDAGASGSGSGNRDDDHQAHTDAMMALMQGMLQSQMEQTALMRQQMERQEERLAQHQGAVVVEPQGHQGGRPGTVENFYRMKPTLFTGDEPALEAEDWIVAIDESLAAARIAEGDRIPMVRRLLRGNARSWWQVESAGAEAGAITWAQFMEKFLKQFFPDTEAALMEEQFSSLTQGDRTVDQYAAEFTSLSRFAADLVATEVKKVKRFRRGLRSEIRTILAAQPFRSFAEILQAARLQERELPQQSLTRVSPGKRSSDQGSSGTASQ